MIRKTNARIAACYSLTCHAKKKVACTCGEVFKCLSMCIYIYISLSLFGKKCPVTFFWVYIIVLYNYMLVFLQCKILSKIIRKEFGTFVSVAGSSSILWKKCKLDCNKDTSCCQEIIMKLGLQFSQVGHAVWEILCSGFLAFASKIGVRSSANGNFWKCCHLLSRLRSFLSSSWSRSLA